MGAPRPRNLPAGISYLTAKRATLLVTAKRATGARQKTHHRKATAALRKHCHAKTFAHGSRESAALAKAVQEFPSARGVREECGTSPCRHYIPELRKLPRNSGLPGRAKSQRCGKSRESAAKRCGRRFEFPRPRAGQKAWRRDPRFRCAHAFLLVRRLWKRFFASG